MEHKCTIFFSWQSDIRNNRNFIAKKIQAAIQIINQSSEFQNIELIYDHGTMKRSGSPDIVKTIHEKINTCAIFIGDITPIATLNNGNKQIPNPNVMTECGFALRAIGEDRIILLLNGDYGDIDKVPFDIKGRRINLFRTSDSSFSLVEFIKSALETAIAEKTNIYERTVRDHDTEIFRKLETIIKDESFFFDNFTNIVNIQRISNWDYKILRNVVETLNRQENKFLIPEIQVSSENLKTSILGLKSFLGVNFSPMLSAWQQIPLNPSLAKLEEVEKEQYYSWIDRRSGEVLPPQTYDEKLRYISQELNHWADEIQQDYCNFRHVVKTNLFI